MTTLLTLVRRLRTQLALEPRSDRRPVRVGHSRTSVDRHVRSHGVLAIPELSLADWEAVGVDQTVVVGVEVEQLVPEAVSRVSVATKQLLVA